MHKDAPYLREPRGPNEYFENFARRYIVIEKHYEPKIDSNFYCTIRIRFFVFIRDTSITAIA